jgi:hypothetical protein
MSCSGNGEATPTVHRFLDYLHLAGIDWVPKPVEVSLDATGQRGQERLSYLDGDVPAYPLPQWVWRDEVLCCRLPVPWDHPRCQKHGTTSRPQPPAEVMISTPGRIVKYAVGAVSAEAQGVALPDRFSCRRRAAIGHSFS